VLSITLVVVLVLVVLTLVGYLLYGRGSLA